MHIGRWTQAEVVLGGRWAHAASGVARRANVRLCLASRLKMLWADFHEILEINGDGKCG